ncbi:MAG: alginate export family protein [Gemmatimonadetes bacterium]|nr:alginate export family protein [Gemmatimonadota bacterium]
MRSTFTFAAAVLMLLGSGVPLAAQSDTTRPVTQQGAQATPAANQPGSPTLALPITFTGEVRSRTEWDAPGGAAAADLYSMLRTRFAARVDPTANVSVVLQLQDSRVLGTETNSRVASTVDQFDLHQGYLQLAGSWRASDLALRAGRQEIVFGNERLVGAANWTNAGRTFDGMRALATAKGAGGADRWSATAFAAIMEENGRRFGGAPSAAPTLPDHFVAGAHLTRGAPQKPGVDVTLLYDGGAQYRSFADADRATLDARVRTAIPAGLRLELEGAAQSGTQSFVAASGTKSGQRVRAWLLGARLARTVSRAALTLGVDALSGDTAPTDGRYTAFSTMFATNHPFYGLMDVIGDPAATTKERGLHDAFGTAALNVTPSFAPRVELHRFALATGTDRALGLESDLVAPIKLPANTVLDLGFSLFRNGTAARALGLGDPGTMKRWLYVQLRAGF